MTWFIAIQRRGAPQITSAQRDCERLRHRDASTKNLPVPTYQVRRLAAGDRVKLDGRLDEPFWHTTPQTQPFVHPGTGESLPESAPLGGTARLRWDDEHLYVAIVAKDIDVRGGFAKDARDPHLWTKDTVEIMLDPEGDGDNRDYYEIQVNPQGLVFDSHFDDYNRPRVLPDEPFGHEDWSALLERTITIQGTIDDPNDVDEGYVVELAMPFRALANIERPRKGTVWRANFYVMQNNGGVSWSPILGQGNFHKASRFGRLEFVR
ncbi:MAG: carbohydrate-binding family 9-like protein [Polyangiaceae bacterium]